LTIGLILTINFYCVQKSEDKKVKVFLWFFKLNDELWWLYSEYLVRESINQVAGEKQVCCVKNKKNSKNQCEIAK